MLTLKLFLERQVLELLPNRSLLWLDFLRAAAGILSSTGSGGSSIFLFNLFRVLEYK